LLGLPAIRSNYRTCYSVFACGGPYETRIGAAPIVEHDLTKARQLVQESGYDGYPVVAIQVTDWPLFNAAAFVTRQRLESVGFKGHSQANGLGDKPDRAGAQGPPDKGGWNLLHTFFQAADVINPAVHFALSGAGSRAWYGWPDIPQLEKLVNDWVGATDEPKRQRLADEIQRVAYDEVLYVPWGQMFAPTAFRKNVRDVLKFAAPLFWNVKLA